jgi:hypothetical protein
MEGLRCDKDCKEEEEGIMEGERARLGSGMDWKGQFAFNDIAVFLLSIS